VADTCHVTPHAHKTISGDAEIGTSHHVWGVASGRSAC
jgi:hypothetical protein